MIEAKIICDSVTNENVRITTVQLKYHRYIHGEFLTHRVFSRNSSSSRAIPFTKTLKNILDDMAYPTHWGANIPGMQAKEEVKKKKLAKFLWKAAGYTAVSFAYLLNKLGLHKQVVNRIVEPWTYINVIVTSTQWNNFFTLRNHPDAQPEIKILAEKILAEFEKSVPNKLKDGEWHLPYISTVEKLENSIEDLCAMSVARCARVSYLTHDGKTPSKEKDINLYNRLVVSEPLHASPAEHQCKPDTKIHVITMDEQNNTIFDGMVWKNPELHGNLTGAIQFRKTLMREFIAG